MCVGFMRLKWGDCARRGIRVNLFLRECRDLGVRGGVVLCFGMASRGGYRAKHGSVKTDY